MPIWPLKSPKSGLDADRLLAAVTAASRQPSLYGEGKVPDTLEGRFELMTLCASLVLHRLKNDPPLAQLFVDRLFRQFDAGLREAAVGDTAVPKRMHRMAGAFYGRSAAYEAGFAGRTSLADAIERNVLGEGRAFAEGLEGWARGVADRQRDKPIAGLFEPEAWRFNGL